MKALHALAATGPSGFEELCALLLRKLTGTSFRPSRSGPQGGRDLDSDRSRPWFIAVECKRYAATTQLDERELSAEIRIAHRREPGLDMWVLAASRGVDANLTQWLRNEADETGLDLQLLPCGTAQAPEALDVLCAAFASDVTAFCERVRLSTGALRTFLDRVRKSDEFDARLSHLRAAFDEATVGLPAFRSKMNAGLADYLRDETVSRARLGNALASGPSTPLDVPRVTASEQLHGFLKEAQKEGGPRLCVVQGDEGNGKSWSVASWVRGLLGRQDSPAVFWFKASDAGDQGALGELARKANSQLQSHSPDLLRLKMQRWFKRSGEAVCIVVLDGINERREVSFWAQYILSLSVETNSSVLVVLTCRQQTWSDLKPRLAMPAVEINLGEFSREEFLVALQGQDRDTVERLWALGAVAHKPRYLADALAYLKAGGRSQELTVERLYYESWRNRVRRRPDYPLGESDFEGLLRRLARETEGRLRTSEILDGLGASVADPRPVLRELSTSGVLQVRNDGTSQLTRRYLVEGLSLLLLDFMQVGAGPVQELRDRVGAFILDTQQQPLTAEICAAAAFKSIVDPAVRDDVSTALILEFLGCQNAEQSSIEGTLAIAAKKPNALAQVAEVLWSYRDSDVLVETVFLRTFMDLAKNALAGDQVVNIIARWAGFVHESGEYTGQDVGGARTRCEVRVREVAPSAGAFAIASDPPWTLNRVENQLQMRLARLALAVVSFADRQVFFQAILNCLVADTLMGTGRSGLCGWILGSSRQPLASLVLEALPRLDAVTVLDEDGKRRVKLQLFEGAASPAFSKQLAAARIPVKTDPHWEEFRHLWRIPTPAELSSYLLDSAVPFHRKLDVAAKFAADPGVEFPKNFLRNLCRAVDLLETPQRRIGRGWTQQDYSWAEMEPLLCRLAPHVYASKASEFLRSVQERSAEGVLGWSFDAAKYAPLGAFPELEAIRRVWEQDYLGQDGKSDLHNQVEGDLFELLLPFMTGAQQVQQLIRRGENARQHLKFEHDFEDDLDEKQQRQLAAMAKTDFELACALWVASVQEQLAQDVWLPVVDLALNGSSSLARGMASEVLARFPAQVQKSRVSSLRMPDEKDGRIERYWTTRFLLEHSDAPPAQILAGCDLSLVAELLGQVSPERREVLAPDFAAEVLLWLRRQVAPNAGDTLAIPVEVRSPVDGTRVWSTVSVDWGLLDNSVTYRSEMSVWGGISSDDGGAMENALNQNRHSELHRALIKAMGQSANRGDWGYATFWSNQTMEALIETPNFPPHLESLLERVLGQRQLRSISSFISSYARVLIRRGDVRGFALLESVEDDQTVRLTDGLTGFDTLEMAVFAFPDAEEGGPFWRARLEAATSDAQILACCELLVAGKNEAWLRAQAEEDMASEAPYFRRRGLLLLAGSGADAATIRLWADRIEADASAMEDVLRVALAYAERLEHMRHWLRAMTEGEDELARVCAATLLMHCADQRVWPLLADGEPLRNLPEYVKLLDSGRMKRAIKDLLKERDKRLLGYRKYDLDADPWVKSQQRSCVTMRL